MLSLFVLIAPSPLGLIFLILTVVMVIGLAFGIYAYEAASNNNFHKAGVFAIVSSFLPPLDIIILIGGILCLVSKEGKK